MALTSNILQRLAGFFRPSRPPQPSAEELREAFRGHYRHFRSLLTANNNALELMASLEQALTSGRPFGMALVRGHCTALMVNVHKMIQCLHSLSDGRYPGLKPAFAEVVRQVETILSQEKTVTEGGFILRMDEIDRDCADQVGEKMANLGEVRNRVGLTTPDGFAITAAAARRFMEASNLQPEINRRLKAMEPEDLEQLYTTSAAIQKLISTAPLPEDLAAQLSSAHQELLARMHGKTLVALRSSAIGEDSMNVSFAGQYRTQLNVAPEELFETYREIVAGKYRSQAIVYRQQRGFRHQDVHMCVGCLAMVEATVSGVAYSRPPGNPRSPLVVIEAARGLAVQVVDGKEGTTVIQVERQPPFAIRAGDGFPSSPLSAAQAAELAQAAIRLEEHFGEPQDIEWSFDEQGRLFILQSRPMGHAAPEAEPAVPLAASEPDHLPPPLLAGGMTASHGVGCGPVFVVRTSLDLLQFPQGAVLVVSTPFPDWATVLDRATAVVSETGQVAAHLATVAREFGVPAIFGLAEATTRLANGQEITVDATARRIHPGRVEELLALAAPRPNLMAGSPVHRLLGAAMEHISPLNLTDPGSPFFRPSNCRTLHDLTRFCHEKSVTEMFSFGERVGLHSQAAKQLVVENSPAQWWVIDLDDGFRPDLNPKSPFIQLSDIVSIPMQAVWAGMTAVPWAGPPPISLRGFGSILFQSTRNPHLDPGVRANLGSRNYFLVSKNFCNLSVRLGYHFALVEANISDLLTESYLSFQFKGGAADEHRRRQRVELLKDFLTQADFRVEQRGDALAARVEKRPAEYLLERLAILGYLLIHTRQIDMVMGDPQAMAHHIAKIGADIAMLRRRYHDEEGNHDPKTTRAAD
ncbi:MAG: PEP/pyruvate-binding domain-containing protein [Thermodesulfobacteriota bacterium]